jgi:hypothetical protein
MEMNRGKVRRTGWGAEGSGGAGVLVNDVDSIWAVLGVPMGIKPKNSPGPEAVSCPSSFLQSRFCFHNVPI